MSERLEKMPAEEFNRLKLALKELARRHVAGTLTVREAAKTLRLRQDEIMLLADDAEHLTLIVGYAAHSGHASIPRQGDYRITYDLY